MAPRETTEDRAAAAAAVARAHADVTEAGRRLAPAVVAAFKDAALLRMAAPVAIGAPEAPAAESLRAAEAVARADASAGWCVSIHVTSSLLGGYLAPDAARAVLGSPDAVAAGVWAPRGQAVAVDGGVRVSGRWAFCSGIDHSDWLFAGCVLDGAPRVVALAKADLEVLDTWHTTGLRGTGSHDAVATDAFVPAGRVIALADGPVVDAPLYRFPIFGFFAASVAAAALGNARGAMDELLALAGGKVGLGSSRTLAERPATQAAVGEAEATLRAARAFFYEAIDACWAAAVAGPVGVDARRDLRLAATYAGRRAADVVRSLHALAGGTSIYAGGPLERRFRDAHTATAHFQIGTPTWELCGRLLLGLETDASTL